MEKPVKQRKRKQRKENYGDKLLAQTGYILASLLAWTGGIAIGMVIFEFFTGIKLG